MKILLCSRSFSPAIGGIETVSLLLARSWTAAGEEVRVVTRSAGGGEDDQGLQVVRQPSRAELAKQIEWSDVVLQNNISLPWILPILRSRKPWVCANHTWPRDRNGKLDWRGRLKRRAALLARAQLGVSDVQAAQFLGHPIVVGNPYDDAFFRPLPGIERDSDLVFLGRLTDDKGIDLAIRALPAVIKARPETRLSIIGKGEDREFLESLVSELGVKDHVKFLGALFGEPLLAELSRHKVALVPSRASESFGISVIECMACGCVVIASDTGGLPEAVGPAGMTFPSGDVDRLAEAILKLLETPGLLDSYRSAAPAHLERFKAANVARRYLEVLRKAAGK